MNTKEIRQQLELAWDRHQTSNQDAAFEHLHNALSMLVRQVEKLVETDQRKARQ